MDAIELTQTEDIVEVSEAEETQAAEEQSLEDATHDSGAHVEQNQTLEQAESVELALSEVVDSMPDTTAQAEIQ